MQAEPTEAGDPLEVERHRHGRPVRVARDDRQQARQALLRVARQLGPRRGEDRLGQPVALAARAARRSRPARRRRGRRRRPARPRRRRSRCRRGGGAPGCRPAAGPGCACRAGRTARRRPSGPRTCGRRARPGPRRAPRRRGRGTARPGPRRRGAATPLRARTTPAISAIGWIVPTSLLASMIETRIVRSRDARASSWSGSTRP